MFKLDYTSIAGRANGGNGVTVRLSAFAREMLLDTLAAMDRTWWVQPTADENHDFIKSQIDNATEAIMKNLMIGTVLWGAWEEVPEGTLICDGDVYLRSAYPELSRVLGSNYIIDEEYFRVPLLIDRFARGAYTAGIFGGEDSVTLTEAQLPAHAHGLNLFDGLVVGPGEVPVTIPSLIQLGATNYTGGGMPHNNVPRYETLVPVIVAE